MMNDIQWLRYPSKIPYLTLENATMVLVRMEPLPKGYLWQVHTSYGYEPTLEAAKEMAWDMLGLHIRKPGGKA